MSIETNRKGVRAVMKALRKTEAGRGHLELQDVPVPEIGPEDLLLRVSYCGVCGSDLHMEDGTHPCSPPLTIGHEFCGVVERTGAAVSGFERGDAVAFLKGWRPYPGSGGDGGFAEFMRAPAANMWKLPAGVTLQEASQFETVITPMRLVRDEAKIQPGDRVVVTGVGMIGLVTIALAQIHGAEVIAVGTERDLAVRLPLAERMGAVETLVFGTESLAHVKALKPKTWIDASGAAAALEAAAMNVDCGGTVIAAGLGHGPWNIDMVRVVYDSITLKGVWGGRSRYLGDAAQMMADGRLDIKPLLSVMPLSRWREAFDALRRQEFVKVLLEPGIIKDQKNA